MDWVWMAHRCLVLYPSFAVIIDDIYKFDFPFIFSSLITK